MATDSTNTATLLTSNKIVDFISGELVNATPEEVNAVQVYSRTLVDDYGYAKEQIQTRPQFRVKASPSDTEYKYPVDIVVFKNHIGIVSDKRNKKGIPFIIHNQSPYQSNYEEDILESRNDIVGHYRMS